MSNFLGCTVVLGLTSTNEHAVLDDTWVLSVEDILQDRLADAVLDDIGRALFDEICPDDLANKLLVDTGMYHWYVKTWRDDTNTADLQQSQCNYAKIIMPDVAAGTEISLLGRFLTPGCWCCEQIRANHISTVTVYGHTIGYQYVTPPARRTNEVC